MRGFILSSLIILFNNITLQNQIEAEPTLNAYMNDFYSKSNEARQILREIEIDLKNGSRINKCARQRKAAKLGIMANDSLAKIPSFAAFICLEQIFFLMPCFRSLSIPLRIKLASFDLE